MFAYVQSIILAAGKSSRFNTNKTKLAEKICGQSMILYQIRLLHSLSVPVTIVVGYQKELIQTLFESSEYSHISYINQTTQSGTADALKCTRDMWYKDHILIMNSDIPLITQDIIESLYTKHISTDAALTFVTSHDDNPHSDYGRVTKKNKSIEIVKTQHITDNQEYSCINAGIYLAKKEFLNKYIDTIEPHKDTHEYCLTDLVKIAVDNNQKVETITAPFDYVRSVNTLQELWAIEQIKRADIIRMWMNKGVRFATVQNVHIDLTVILGAGTYIGSGVHLGGSTHIGPNCIIQSFCVIENSTIEEYVTVDFHSIIRDSHIKKQAHVGPFAHLRNNSTVGSNARIGNFVEIKNSTIGNQSKASHLSYIGDATIGTHVNVGAGTITANYDGVRKNKTIIKNNVSLGAHTTLVAPVTLEKGSYTAAGSTITDNVPACALAFGRARQINKENYALLLQEKIKNKYDTLKKETKKTTKKVTFLSVVKIKNP